METRTTARTPDVATMAAAVLGLGALVFAAVLIVHPWDLSQIGASIEQTQMEVWVPVHYTIAASTLAMAVAAAVLATRPGPFTRETGSTLGVAVFAAGSALMVPVGLLEATAAPYFASRGDSALYGALAEFTNSLVLFGLGSMALGAFFFILPNTTATIHTPRWAAYLAALAAMAVVVGLVVGVGARVPEMQALVGATFPLSLWIAWAGLRTGGASRPTDQARRVPV